MGRPARGSRTRLDVHHIRKRAQGGSDFDLEQLVALCRDCHDRTDAPYARGRLVVTPLGGGRFAFAVLRGAGKCGAEVVDQWESLGSPSAGGEDAMVCDFAHVGKPGEPPGQQVTGSCPRPGGDRS